MADFISSTLGVAAALIIITHPQQAGVLFVMFCLGYILLLIGDRK